MPSATQQQIEPSVKEQVHDFWNAEACGVMHLDKDIEKYAINYFEELEQQRYQVESEIFSFAQFTRFHGKKVLEVGTGAGTDFLQWVRAGAEAYGIDLTQESIDHVNHRLDTYGLKAAEIKVGDAENISHEENFFDLVYSWGVIHHTPDTEKALAEIVRVCKPGGTVKLMLYNRRSVVAYGTWLTRALLKGQPWRSLEWVLHNHVESIGTKGYTVSEVEQMISSVGGVDANIETKLCFHDYSTNFQLLRLFRSGLAKILGDKAGWFMMIEFKKPL